MKAADVPAVRNAALNGCGVWNFSGVRIVYSPVV